MLRIPDKSGADFVLKLPRKDRKKLEFLFSQFISYDDFSYCLFGSKPMSLSGYPKPFIYSNWMSFRESIQPRYIKMHLAWKTWLKYRHHFQNPNFVIWKEKSPWWKDEGIIILIANKQKMNFVIQHYAEDFSSVLGEAASSAESLLEKASKRPLFEDVLKCHEGLIGILLGYGRNNAFLFHQRDLGACISLSSIWEEGIVKQMSQPEGDMHLVLHYPCCMVDPNSEETKRLRDEFISTREKIFDYYRHDEYTLLEKTLALLR